MTKEKYRRNSEPANETTIESNSRFKELFSTAKTTLLDRSQNVDTVLLWLIVGLVVGGMIMMCSASFAYAQYYFDGDSYYFFRNQFVYAVLGLILMFLVSLYPTVRLKKWNLPILLISTVLLIIVILPFMPKINGVHRWINLGITSFQPSEITKFAIILFGAAWADSHADKMHEFKWGVLPFACVLGLTGILLIAEPHISCTVLVLLLGLTMMFVGGTRLFWFAIIAGVAVVGVAGIIFSGEIGYSFDRIEVWKDPFIDPRGDGWQNIQSLYAISSGGLFGQGLGYSRQKYLYISEPQNDFVFAVVCEELGFIGAAAVIAVFVIFVWRGFTVSVNHPNRFCKLLGIGITSQVGWQALLNVAVVTKVIPNTGISLPFFSYGGSSLVMLLIEMGVLLAISRGSTVKKG